MSVRKPPRQPDPVVGADQIRVSARTPCACGARPAVTTADRPASGSGASAAPPAKPGRPAAGTAKPGITPPLEPARSPATATAGESLQLTVTRAACETCLKIVNTRVLLEGNAVWFEKHCPDHGVQRVKVADDARAWRDAAQYHRVASMPRGFSTAFTHGCPDDCGFCPHHEQHVCLPIIEITDHCDLHCPICLVRNRQSRHMGKAELDGILDRLLETEGSIDVVNLSGGEPTLHPQFREMVETVLARKEVLRVSISTNGRRLVEDETLVPWLKERNVVISLQYDGNDPKADVALRGEPTLERKRRLLDRLTELDAACSLTCTLTAGINDHCLGDLIDLLFARPNILSVMVQPAAFAGTGQPMLQTATRRIFIPEVIERLVAAGGGRLAAANFSPLPCSHPNCFSLAFYLQQKDGGYLSLREMFEADRYLNIIRNRTLIGTDADNFSQIEGAVYDLWSGPAGLTPDGERSLGAIRALLKLIQGSGAGYHPTRALEVAERRIKSIFIHAFMDPGTFDVTRVRKCCQVYPQIDGRFIPACVHNVLGRR